MSSVRRHLSSGLTAHRLRLEARRSRRAVIVVALATAVAAAATGAVLSNLDTRWPWTDGRTYRVLVKDATGVTPGRNDVRISGVAVGKITAVRRAGPDPVLLIEIADGAGPLFRDARVELRPRTPLEDLYLDVRRGTSVAGNLRSDETVHAARSSVAVRAGEVLDTFDAPTRSRLQTLLQQGGRALGGESGRRLSEAFAELGPFLHSARSLTEAIADRSVMTRRLVHDFRRLSGELATRDRQLEGLVRHGARALGALASDEPALAGTIRQLPSTLRRAQRVLVRLQSVLDKVDPALVSLRPSARALGPGLLELRRIADAAAPSLPPLRTAVRRVGPVAHGLRPTALSLERGLGRLGHQAPRFDRITARIVPCKLAVQGFFQWTASVFKFADVNGSSPRGEVTAGPGLTQGESCAGGRAGG